MEKLLYLEASPRKTRSASIAVAKAFLETYAAAHPEDQIDALDLWTLPLPEFDGETIDAKYAVLHGQSQTPDQVKAWDAVKAIISRFTAADKYLFSLPMWNFGIPYKLKHFIDVITQPDLTFSYSPSAGYKGLVTKRPAAVVYARGGAYPVGTPGEAYDLQKVYVQLWLGFIGFTDIRPILVEPTLGTPETIAEANAAAADLARQIAQEM